MVSPVRRMWRGMAEQRGELVLAGLAGLLASTAVVALLGTSAWLISRAAEAPPVLTLTVAAVMVRAFALGRAVFRYLERILGHDAAFRGLTSLRVTVFDRMERLAPVGLARFARGDMLTRLVGDVDAALDLPLRIVLPWVQAAIVAAGAVAFCLWLVPGAGALIAVVALLGLTLVPWAVGALAARAERRIAPAKAELSAAVVASLESTADLVAYDRVAAATAHVSGLDRTLTALSRRSAAALGVGGGVTVALQGIAVVGALVLAIPSVTSGRLAPVWLAVIALLPLALFEVIGTLPASALALQRLRGSAERVAALELAPDPVPEPLHPRAVPSGFAGLELRGVSAGWLGERTVLHDVHLRVEPGEHVAIVGPSGAGKSTLVAVLCGFLAYQGSYALNGVEAAEADGDALREVIGVLAQQAHVFDTTIVENIRLGRREVTDERAWQALEQAQFADAVRAMPRGLDTAVGAFGTAISGGEGQRLALARFLVDPRPVLILDEPTEHLDPRTAASLAATLEQASAGLTRIEVTHRLRTLPDDIRVVVLVDGRIAADGRVGELARQPGWFADRLADEQREHDLLALIDRLPVGRGVSRDEAVAT